MEMENAFAGQKESPSDEKLTAALGKARVAWDQLLQMLAADYGVDIAEWSSYSVKAGWSLRMKQRKRTIVWLSPAVGCFQVMFILGTRATAAAAVAGLSAVAHQALEDGVKYSEGTGVRLVIRNARELGSVKKLVAIKLAH